MPVRKVEGLIHDRRDENHRLHFFTPTKPHQQRSAVRLTALPPTRLELEMSAQLTHQLLFNYQTNLTNSACMYSTYYSVNKSDNNTQY